FRCGHVGALKVHRVAFGQDTGPTDIDQNSPRLGRGFYDSDDLADVIGALGSCIDKACDAIFETKCGTIISSTGMGVNVNQSWDYKLVSSIVCFGGMADDIGLNSGNSAPGDRHIANTVNLARRIDTPAAFDDDVIFSTRSPEYIRNMCTRQN